MTSDQGLRVSHRINGERVVLLGWPRAILLQLAHPLVAAGVYDHSGFRASPIAAVRRLHGTTRAMLDITFGSPEARETALAGVRAIHKRVNGTLRENVGKFPAGTPYSAEDPSLLLWVHTTLIQSMIETYERLVGPLTPEERDLYSAASASVPVALGARMDEVPTTWEGIGRHVTTTIEDGSIVAGTQALALRDALLTNGPARFVPPARWMNRLLTVGWLPASVRTSYGLVWDDRQERALRQVTTAIRRARRLSPDFLARFRASDIVQPELRAAGARERAAPEER